MNTIKRVEHDLRPHNAETIKRILEFYEQSNKCCAIQATGTGKTFLILRLLEIFNDEGKTAVVLAPNEDIIKQTKKKMKKFGLNNAEFVMYQKLQRMSDEDIADIKTDLIVCDELHRTGAKIWGAKFEVLVETHPQAKVFGVTATPVRCTDGRDMAEEYFDNNKACDISLAEALVREIIPVMPLYVSGLFTFEEEYENMREKIKNSDNSNEEKAELQEALLAAKKQMEKAKGIPQIIKKYITNYNGKYIVFCKNKKHLYEMKDVVVGWFREAGYKGEIYEYPYYSNSSEVKKNLDNFEANKGEGLKLLFVIDKLNEGLHLDEIHGCILLRTTGSNIVYYQQIGRVIDAGSNGQRVILDLVSNFNSLKSFNFKKELENKMVERREGKFAGCSEEFEIDKFNVVDLIQDCVDVFNEIDGKLCDWWDVRMSSLKQYYEREGHSNVPLRHIEFFCDRQIQLGRFVIYIRKKKHTLTTERIEQLKRVDFVWNLKDTLFLNNVEKIKKFCKERNCSVSEIHARHSDREQMQVADLISKYKTNLAKGIYENPKYSYKIKILKDIGITTDRMWDVMFKSWLEAKKIYGNNIPKTYTALNGNGLYAWIVRQRWKFNKGQLEKDRVEKLLENGFVFEKNSNKTKRIKVYCGDRFIGEFLGQKEIVDKFESDFGVKLRQAGISKVLTGDRDSYKGYKFNY